MRTLLFLLSILLIPILFLSFLSAGTLCTQKEGSSHLLWYKGKKIRPNVLLTQSGDTVRYDPAAGTVHIAGRAESQLDQMMIELQRTPQRIEEMLKKLSATVPGAALRSYGFQVRTSFRHVQNNFNSALSNTLSLPSVKLSKGPGTSVAQIGNAGTEIAFSDAVAELEKYPQQNHASPSLPEPPQYDYEYCGECETQKRAVYQKNVDEFIGEMIADEKSLIDRATGISRQSQLALSEKANASIQSRLGTIIDLAMQRMLKKVNYLVYEYIDNAAYCEAVANLALRVDRYMQLLGFEADPNISSAFERANVTLTGMISKAIDENDYSVARNINLLLSTARQFQLLGKEMPGNVFEKALAFNADESYRVR